MIEDLIIKRHDRQPYYYAKAVNVNGFPINLTGATIVATMQDIELGTLKINRQSAGIVITDAVNSEFEYQWQAIDVNTIGRYEIEFEVTPDQGEKFTLPHGDEKAIVRIIEDKDNI